MTAPTTTPAPAPTTASWDEIVRQRFQHPGYSPTLGRRRWSYQGPSSTRFGASRWGDYALPGEWENMRYPKEAGDWRPAYEPTFWENPINVARAYWDLKSAAPGQEIPEYLTNNQPAIEEAYKYLSFVNKGDDWVNWKFIHPDDPVRGFLQSLDNPPVDYYLQPDEYQQWLVSELAQKPYKQWDPKLVSKLTPEYRAMLEGPAQQMESGTPFEELPMWQQWATRIMGNSVTSGLAAAAPFAVMGGIGGAAFGPGGVLLGAGIPLALGAGLSGASSEEGREFMSKYLSMALGQTSGERLGTGIQTTAANLLRFLDYPAEWLEQGVGLGIQAIASAQDPGAYGAFQEILANLPAAGRAGGIAYTTEAGALIPNMGAAAEWVYRAITSQNPELVKFAQRGQVWELGQAEPVSVDVYGAAALTAARREIMAGADPEEVIARYTQQFGFSGQMQEMLGHMVLDPLNILPKAAARGTGLLAKAGGNIPLAKAFGMAEGPLQGWKLYQNLIRTGVAGAADELSAFEKFAGGLTETGLN